MQGGDHLARNKREVKKGEVTQPPPELSSELPSQEVPGKRPRGRPRKNCSELPSELPSQRLPRKRGRPKKNRSEWPSELGKRPRGRPRKIVGDASGTVKLEVDEWKLGGGQAI